MSAFYDNLTEIINCCQSLPLISIKFYLTLIALSLTVFRCQSAMVVLLDLTFPGAARGAVK